MHNIEIYTLKHTNELKNFFNTKNIEVKNLYIENKTHYFLLEYKFLIVKDISLFIQEIVLNSNPILKNSNTAKEKINNIVFNNSREMLNRDLYYIVHTHGSVNIDGFINFKLNKFIHDINNILYCTVKINLNNLLTFYNLVL